MKLNKRKISFIFVLFSVVMSALFIIGFYFGMNSYIKNEATTALQETMSYYQDTTTQTTDVSDRMDAYAIPLTDDFDVEGNESDFYFAYSADTLEDLAEWVEENSELNAIDYVEEDDRYYYISVFDSNHKYYLAFVDVTPEIHLVYRIAIIMLIILFISLLAASAIGLFIGTTMEKDHNRQKEFFENASHELKTPLMIIQGYADGLQEELISPANASQHILKETDKMKGLVNEIMNLSRLESGAIRLEKIDLSLADFLEDCLHPLRFQAKQRQILIEDHITDANIKADPKQLELAISNIVNNALRYAETTIRITANQNEIKISNDGQPLSENEIKHIFDRFYTGNNGNTGIGMALTQEIIKKHGWKIQVSNDEYGAVFTIQLK